VLKHAEKSIIRNQQEFDEVSRATEAMMRDRNALADMV
jgi:hypothetical protein